MSDSNISNFFLTISKSMRLEAGTINWLHMHNIVGPLLNLDSKQGLQINKLAWPTKIIFWVDWGWGVSHLYTNPFHKYTNPAWQHSLLLQAKIVAPPMQPINHLVHVGYIRKSPEVHAWGNSFSDLKENKKNKNKKTKHGKLKKALLREGPNYNSIPVNYSKISNQLWLCFIKLFLNQLLSLSILMTKVSFS